VAVNTLENAIEAINAIRQRGHHRVVVKEAYGLAGHNAIRLWEPEILPSQMQWLVHACRHGRQVVIEPWLERELDFSIQLEMGPRGLVLCGCTGLINDRRGQFVANWAEPEYAGCLPATVASLLCSQDKDVELLRRLYAATFSLLDAELRCAGFAGPISIDALVYRTTEGECRLKPVVEINPRYTMGRLTVELMKHVYASSCGVFRLVNRAQALAQGASDFIEYARSLRQRCPLLLEDEPARRIRQGALCLNDPEQAKVCLAIFEVNPAAQFDSASQPRQ
jgi:hypothetical protein